MYRGFDLKLDCYFEDCYEKGKEIFEEYENKIKENLKDYALQDGILDGSIMQSTWFPNIKANVFISHSHKDKKKAIALSGWLYDKFGIKSFIDSCIWGYSNDLLRIIDNKYCYQKKSNTYNYHSRNYSTSHVHMMLSVALTKMIDKTECIFFLNTPNSITTSSIIEKTESPWIFSEIATTQIIRKQIPIRRVGRESKYFSKGGSINESLRIQYELDLSHLTELNIVNLKNWKREFAKQKASLALDRLYDQNPIKNKMM